MHITITHAATSSITCRGTCGPMTVGTFCLIIPAFSQQISSTVSPIIHHYHKTSATFSGKA